MRLARRFPRVANDDGQTATADLGTGVGPTIAPLVTGMVTATRRPVPAPV